MDKIKVLLLTTSFPNYKGHSRGIFIERLADALSKKTILKVLLPYNKNFAYKNNNFELKTFKYFPDALETLTEKGGIAENISNPIGLLQIPFFSFFYFLKTIKESKDADIIHANWIVSAIPGLIAKLIYKKPLVVTIRGAGFNLFYKNRIGRLILRLILNNCEYIISNNFYHYNLLKNTKYKHKVATISNGLDLKKFKPITKKSNKTTITFVGWLIKRKGVDYLIKSLPEVIKKHKNITINIIGEGYLEKPLKDFCKKEKISSYINFTGLLKQDEVIKYLQKTNIFILPSLAEGRPNTILEAMACKCAIITTNIHGNSDFIKNYENGVLIPIKNHNIISEKLIELIKNKNLQNKLSRNARKTIKDLNLSWDACAKKYIQKYNYVLK